jgi:hypothetical protein
MARHNLLALREGGRRRFCATLAVIASAAVLLFPSCAAWADGVSRACAASPYHVGDLLRRLGPPGDQSYNSLRVRKIYVLFGPTRKADCLAVSSWCRSHPEPAYMQRIAGWLYLTDVSANGDTYNWYSRGYEMDTPLEYVYDTLATVVLSIAHACR